MSPETVGTESEYGQFSEVDVVRIQVTRYHQMVGLVGLRYHRLVGLKVRRYHMLVGLEVCRYHRLVGLVGRRSPAGLVGWGWGGGIMARRWWHHGKEVVASPSWCISTTSFTAV